MATVLTAYEQAKVDIQEKVRALESARLSRQMHELERVEQIRQQYAAAMALVEEMLRRESDAILRDGGKPNMDGPHYQPERIYVAMTFLLNTPLRDHRRNVSYKFAVDVNVAEGVAYGRGAPFQVENPAENSPANEVQWPLGSPTDVGFGERLRGALDAFMLRVLGS